MKGKEIYKESGGEIKTTNNRMELEAVNKSLIYCARELLGFSSNVSCPSFSPIIYCDSSYVVKGIKEWMVGWENNSWKRGKGLLLNVDLWKRAYLLWEELELKRRVKLEWIKGHSRIEGNERVDHLCTEEIERIGMGC